MDSADNRTDEWLARLDDVPPVSLALHIATEDHRLSAQLMRLAEDIHTSMSAWHSLGTSDSVRTLFRQLDQHLQTGSKRVGGVLKNLLRRLVDFISEADPQPAVPEDVLRQLDRTGHNTVTYEQRLKHLAEEHRSALRTYRTWVSALTQLAASVEDPAQRSAIQSTIRRSAELVAAQQQLAQAAALQLEAIQRIATDVRHLTNMAKSLSASRDAASQLSQQRET